MFVIGRLTDCCRHETFLLTCTWHVWVLELASGQQRRRHSTDVASKSNSQQHSTASTHDTICNANNQCPNHCRDGVLSVDFSADTNVFNQSGKSVCNGVRHLFSLQQFLLAPRACSVARFLSLSLAHSVHNVAPIRIGCHGGEGRRERGGVGGMATFRPKTWCFKKLKYLNSTDTNLNCFKCSCCFCSFSS